MADYERALLDGGRRVALAVWKVLGIAWKSDRIFLLAVVLAQVFFARRTFQGGIWADNDSVCHYAYLRHLVEDVYPATGSFLGYSPRFNLGVPFLLYNTPPGLYVLSAIVSGVFHISTLAALKVCVLLGFVSVPVLGYGIAKTFDDAQPDAPKFVALLLGLFSSELYGLEFFFKNGMLNPALGVPFLLATVYFFRRAQTAPFPKTLRHVAFAGFFLACTACTHVLSTYMLCLALGAFVLGRGPKHWGHDVLLLGGVLGTGGGLAAFWLIPSAPFAAAQDAAYTWLRRPEDIVSSFLDGSLLSSYFAGFFPRFVTINNVGIVAIILGFIAILAGVRRRETGPLSALLVWGIGFWIMLGPAWSFGIKYLPGYDRLLWYRFLTVAEIGWLILAGFGAAHVAHLGKRFLPYNRLALVAGFAWALVVMGDRATKIETASEYPEFTSDVDQVAGWLKQHGDRRGRIFDEFLGQAVIQPPSVNYIRHMIPILSGFDEIGGWIYENNLAGQILMKKGVFWNSPFPLVDQAPRYNVKYILAGSPHFIRALSFDPRWKDVVRTRNLVLFENVAYEPTFAEGNGLAGNVASQRYLPGGGYEYVVDLASTKAAPSEGPLVVKVGYLPHFTVYADDEVVPTEPSVDGLLQVKLPSGKTPKRLRCVWDISALRTKGNRVSLAAFGLALALVLVSFVKRRLPFDLARPLAIVGLAGGALGLVGGVVKSRHVDLSEVGFGVRNGLSSYTDTEKLEVGSFDDERVNHPIHVLPGAWDKRSTLGRDPARRLAHPDLPALELALPRGRASTVTVRGTPEHAALTLTLEVPGGATTCTVQGEMNAPIVVPSECTAGDDPGVLPGVARDVRLASPEALVVTSVTAKTGIAFVEAESLSNVVDDGGYEAFYGFSAIESWPSNGIVMMADTRLDKPVELMGKVKLPRGRVDVWLLTRTLHPRFHNTRADVSVWLDGERVGSSRGEAQRARDYWERDTIFEWVRIGEANVGDVAQLKLRMAKVKGTVAGLAEVDAVAFVPK